MVGKQGIASFYGGSSTLTIAAFHNQYDDLESYGAVTLTFPTSPYPHTLVTEYYDNGLCGVSDGVEIAPDWKPFNWLDLRGSYSYLNIRLHSRSGFDQTAYAATYEGSSPDHQASVPAVLALRPGLEIVPDYRFVSSLPALHIPRYNTADLNATYHIKKHFALSATGRNLLQPHHQEFTGNNSNAVGIRRSLIGTANWTW